MVLKFTNTDWSHCVVTNEGLGPDTNRESEVSQKLPGLN